MYNTLPVIDFTAKIWYNLNYKQLFCINITIIFLNIMQFYKNEKIYSSNEKFRASELYSI